jgi:hypothetical protein
MRHVRFLLFWSSALAGCGEADPSPGDGSVVDDPIVGTPCATAPAYVEDVSGCVPLGTDYQPRDGGQTNGWPACISDDDLYHQLEPSVSSIARVAAYDAIGGDLWEDGATPTHEDFLAARVLFEEEQGLGSRVARRYDIHYDPPTTGSCEDEGVPAAHPDHCVGPGTLQPIIVAAFADGAEGNHRIVNAYKIEAATQWFLYVSAIKEAFTCTTTAADCDSHWAYYSGGTARADPAGLAADVDALAPETHDRAYDGVLAVRCWRDLDPEETATDLARRDQSIAQLDRALLRGMSILIRQRFLALACSTSDYQQGHLEALRILVPLFDRETRSRSSTAADLLMTEVAKSAEAVDVSAVVDALDSTYPCP